MSGESVYQLGIRLFATGAEAVVGQAKAASTAVDGIGKSALTVGDVTKQMNDKLKDIGAKVAGALTVKAFVDWMRAAVDAGDEMKAFSQKTGVTVKDVAGLQLAFKQGGVEGDALTTAIGKMSKQMLAGNEAFDKLGVKTRNADGSLRDVKDVLYDVADAVAEMGDGAQKSAELQEILGKVAAALIPTLNDGSEGLRKMAEMADKLGLSMSKGTADAADQFNDTVELLGMSLSGIARQAMAQLLPTLNNLVGAFLDSATSGNTLSTVADVLAAGMKLLFSAGVLVVEAFSSVGKTAGAAGAQLMAVMRGDFKGAVEIGKQWSADMGSSWSKTADTIGKAWAESGNSTVTVLGQVVKSQNELGLKTKEEEEAQKKAAEEVAKHAKELDKLAAATRAESAGLSGDFFGKWEELNELRRTGRISVSELEDAQAKLLKQQPFLTEAAKLHAEAVKADNKALDDLFEAEEKARLKNEGQIKAAREMLESIQFETQALTMNSAEREVATALRALEKDGIVAGTQAYDAMAESIRQAVVDREAVKAGVQAQKEATEEIKKLNEDIGKSLTDSLFRAFESGKSFWKTLWDGIKNTLKTTVLKVLISPVQNAITNALGNAAVGSVGSAMAGSAGGSMAGSLIGSAIGGLGAFGGAMSSGFGMAMSGGMGLALEGGAAMVGSATGLSSMMAGIGQIAGALGPIALGIGAVYAIAKALDKGGTPHRGAMYVSDAKGGYVPGDNVVGNMAWGDSVHKNHDGKVEEALKGLTGGGAALLNGLSTAFGGQANFKVGGYWSADGHDASQGNTRIWSGDRVLSSTSSHFAVDAQKGLTEYTQELATQVRLAMGEVNLPEWARKQLAELPSSTNLEDLAKAAANIAATHQALKSLSDAFAPLGGVFGRVAGLSADATLQLAGFAGGIDALIAKTQSYVQAYYSDGERNAIGAASIRRTLAEAGITTDFGSKEELRALIERTDVSNEAGLKQLAVLLDVANAFAPMADYLKAQGQTLDQLAAQAPQVAALQNLQTSSEEAVDYQAQAVEGITTLDNTMVTVGDKITSGFQSLQEVLERGLAAVTSAANATTRQLERWDDGGALTTVAAV